MCHVIKVVGQYRTGTSLVLDLEEARQFTSMGYLKIKGEPVHLSIVGGGNKRDKMKEYPETISATATK